MLLNELFLAVTSLVSEAAVKMKLLKELALTTWFSLMLAQRGHEKLSITISVILLLLAGTYLITTNSSVQAVRSLKKLDKSPPILPYWIPFLGSAISYLWNGQQLIESTARKYGYSVPVGLRLGPLTMYMLSDPEQINVLFKAIPELSKTGIGIAMQYVLGTPKKSLPVYLEDNSGQLLKPNPGSNIPHKDRIRYHHTNASHQFLTGSNGIRMGERYNRILKRNMLSDMVVTDEWSELPDLFQFVQDVVFPAGIESLFGTHILALNPTLSEDYSAFARSIPKLLKRYPRWLVPGPYRCRDKMIQSIKKWHVSAKAHGDYTKIGANDPEWEEYFGSKYVKARQIFFHDIEKLDEDARASEDLGLMFAVTANSVTAVFWTIFEVFSRPDLLSRIYKISESAVIETTEELDNDKIMKNPLLQSIFAEVTRLRVVGIIANTAESDFRLGEWTIPKGAIIGLLSSTGAMNSEVWNAGTKEDPHPLANFWAERFIIDPRNANSGPLRIQGIQSKKMRPRLVETESVEDVSQEPFFSLKGLNGAYIPFGGGIGMCPGRHFSKQEVLYTLVQWSLAYDIEMLTPKGWEPKMDSFFFPTGTLPPAGKVPFRIRRRQS